MSGRTSLVAGRGGSKPGHMEAVQGTISQSRDQDVAAAAAFAAARERSQQVSVGRDQR
jgi:hypothetical protein